MFGSNRPSPHGPQKADALPLSGDFAARFNRSFPRLWALAIGIVHDKHTAEDVVQEAALVGLKNLDQLDSMVNFEAWMARVVRNLSLNVVRNAKRRRTGATDPSNLDLTPARKLDDPGEGSLRLADYRQQLPAHQGAFDDQLTEALNELSPIARACLMLRTIERLDYSRIAQMLEIPKGTAMSHVFRARQQIRRRLTAATQTESEDGEDAGDSEWEEAEIDAVEIPR